MVEVFSSYQDKVDPLQGPLFTRDTYLAFNRLLQRHAEGYFYGKLTVSSWYLFLFKTPDYLHLYPTKRLLF